MIPWVNEIWNGLMKAKSIKQAVELLEFALENNLNVLLIGNHGVGKTSIISQVMEKRGIPIKYYSASTMDPWTDLIGIPKERMFEDGNIYIDYIRPRDIATGTYQALFFDEFNRAKKPVKNAVMELIQFKSINGTPLPNLRVVWAAINPYDDDQTYDVEKLDPAQMDRFHFIIELPTHPDIKWFTSIYGELGKIAVEWWEALDEKKRELVSPRRLEMALIVFNAGGNISAVLDYTTGPKSLYDKLKYGDPVASLRKMVSEDKKDDIIEFLRKENRFFAVTKVLHEDLDLLEYCFDLLPSEKMVKMTLEHSSVARFVTKSQESLEKYPRLAATLVNSGKHKTLLSLEEASRVQDFVSSNMSGESPLLPVKYYNAEDEFGVRPYYQPRWEHIKYTTKVSHDERGMGPYSTLLSDVNAKMIEKSDKVGIIHGIASILKIIEMNTSSQLIEECDQIIPMLNTLCKALEDMGDDVNNHRRTFYSGTADSWLKCPPVHVQGFLDRNSNMCHTRVRLL